MINGLRESRVVMTGGGGFIGSHLLARMVSAGMDVTLLGPDTGRSRYTASLVAQGIVRFFRCDAAFTEDDLLPRIIESADALVLLGHIMPTSSSPARRLLDEINRNIAPMVRLLRAALRGKAHIVFASSVSVYGAPTLSPVRESDPARPLTPYAIAKLTCEQSIEALCGTAPLTASILRYSSVYGPGETVPRAIPNFIRSVLSGTQPLVDGDGRDERDYIHVADVVDATLAALHRKAAGTFNVGTGMGTSTRDLVELVIKLAGARITPRHTGDADPSRQPTKIVCDTQAACTGLGFVARRSLTEGISEELGWFKSERETCAGPATPVMNAIPTVAAAPA
jgi:UDP-glucose 4-epimerase